MNNGKNVCVIGAGVSGLVAVKTCLEDGVGVVCYEKTDSIGGLWKYREETELGVGSVMKSTVSNTSKEMTSYSDFPPPKHFPNFLHHSLFWKYLESYATHFRLFPHIKLNTEVLTVDKNDDYLSTGRWKLRVKHKNGEIVDEIFDAVLLCSGHHIYPNMPQYPGLDSFKGEVIHAREYKKEDNFHGKRILVVGFANSGSDIAVELSRVAKEVLLSTRRGVWLLGRMAEGGLPTDIKYKTRLMNYLTHYSATQLQNWVAEFKANLRFDHAMYSMKPRHGFFSQHPTINDELPNRVLTGFITIKDGIHRFTETGVVFNDDDVTVCNIDVVIFATGYRINFPYLQSEVINLDKNQVTLYKYVFPPQLPHSTLAVIGLVQAVGALPSLSEIQSRWAVRVFKGLSRLPPKSKMMADIEEKRWEINQQYFKSDRHTIQADYIWYQDEIAKMIDAKPDFRFMLFSDPELFWACFFGPMLPYTYRLTGSHKWKGARDAILTCKKRILAPLNTRPIPEPISTGSVLNDIFVCPLIFITLAVVITIAWLIYM